MFKRSVSPMPVVATVLVCLGCRGGSFSLNLYDYDPPPVRVTHVHRHVDHVCSYDCHDHYWDGARVVVVSDHRHGHGCGHVWDGMHWVVVIKRRVNRAHHDHPTRVVKVKHAHGPSCGHVYHHHKHKWLKIKKRHVHGHHCGHVFIEGRWSIRH